MTEVVVTGIGVVSGFGVGTRALWAGLLAGESGLGPITRFPVSGAAWGGEVSGLEVRDVARTALARRIDRTSLLALAAARDALDDAGLAYADLDPERTALSLGSALGNLSETALFLDRLFSRGSANPLVFPNLVMNAALAYGSIELGVVGPTAMLTEQEATGEAAIAWGAGWVGAGVADVCLAGAADELDAARFQVLHETRAISPRAPRLFDPDGDGPCPGEGGAVLVLEPITRARARGARIYARLAVPPSFGVPAPVHGWPPAAGPLAERLRPVLADADLVVTATSGNALRDRLEAEATAAAVAPRAVLATAPRGAIGDFGAAGALGAAVAALAVHQRVVPPTSGVVGTVPEGIDVVTARPRPAALGAAASFGLARGGLCQPLRLEAIH